LVKNGCAFTGTDKQLGDLLIVPDFPAITLKGTASLSWASLKAGKALEEARDPTPHRLS